MFLSQNTPEGWRLRRNLFQLILDKDYTNVELGLYMIQTNDLHFSMFPYIWKFVSNTMMILVIPLVWIIITKNFTIF